MRVVAFALLLGAAVSLAGPAERWSYVDGKGVLRWKDDGSEIALFGVNYYTPFTVDYEGIRKLGKDHRAAIARDVAHFQRMGLDAIRLHVFDRQISDKQGHLLANAHMDLFDELVAQCKRRGIYTVLTPIAWWPYHVTAKGFSSLYTKPQMVLDPQARRAQCTYLREFMEHVNPYTQRAYKDEPAVVAIELINEPIYSPDTTQAQITGYIDELAAAVRSAGAKQPIFYNGWQGREKAVAESTIEGCTFGWYPTGLVAGRCLWGNYLPRADDYPRMRLPCLAGKAKIVYEFDAADVPGRVMYPAMARAFRSGGAQIATQFQYDPVALAPYNYGWQTHYLNLVYAPGKAMSFAIAAEAFRRTPRLARFEPYPENSRFGPFRISHERDLSEMVTADAFLYSNDTDTRPPQPGRLTRIAGCGSSPVARYAGTGAYFLDRLQAGLWRLDVFPDAVWVADPHAGPSLSREVARVLWRSRGMTLRLPDLGDDFTATPLRGPAAPARARAGAVALTPGAYVLTRRGVAPRRVADEFYAPEAPPRPIAVWCEPVKRWRAGCAMPLRATVAAPGQVQRVALHVEGDGPNAASQTVELQRTKPYQYACTVPARLMAEGWVRCWLEVAAGSESHGWPQGALTYVPPAPARALLCAVAGDGPTPSLSGGPGRSVERVAGPAPGSHALRVEADGFGKEPNAAGFRLSVQPPAGPGYTTLCVRARATRPGTHAVEIGLVQRDGRAYGCSVPLWRQWNVERIALTSLRPLWKTRGGQVDPRQVAEVSVVFGAWLYGPKSGEPHGFEIESLWLESHAPRWAVQVLPARGQALLFAAGERRVKPSGQDLGGYGLVRGSKPGAQALRVWSKGFGPPPSSLHFRQNMLPDFDVWRDAAEGCNAVQIVARSEQPHTDSLEVVLLETDGAPWGTVIPLAQEWRTLTLPLSKLRFFSHWRHTAGRGAAGDRFHPERVAAVSFCFGAWLYREHAKERHGIEVESVSLVTVDGSLESRRDSEPSTWTQHSRRIPWNRYDGVLSAAATSARRPSLPVCWPSTTAS